MYTAAIVLGLYEENRIDLDAAITRHLPASLTPGIHVYRGTDYSGRITVSSSSARLPVPVRGALPGR